MSGTDESALVVTVPAAEPLVGPFRAAHDPAAAAGVPAHITLLYPFLHPDRIDDVVLQRLAGLFAAHAGFRFALTVLQSFPVPVPVLFLRPEPPEGFRNLTLAIWDAYPETPPYGGRYPAIVPHLTIGMLANTAELERLQVTVAQAASSVLPLSAVAAAVSLLEKRDGRWTERTRFALAPPKAG